MSSTDLPVEWVVQTLTEVVPSPVDIGQTTSRSLFARRTHVVRDGKGNYVAASGDWWDAVNQALSICQATEQPYDSELWTHDDDAVAVAVARVLTDFERATQELLALPTPEAMFAGARQVAASHGFSLQVNPHAVGQVMLIAPNGNNATFWSLREMLMQPNWGSAELRRTLEIQPT